MITAKMPRMIITHGRAAAAGPLDGFLPFPAILYLAISTFQVTDRLAEKLVQSGQGPLVEIFQCDRYDRPVPLSKRHLGRQELGAVIVRIVTRVRDGLRPGGDQNG